MQKKKQSYAEDRTAQELVLNAIIKAENLQISDDEYKAGVARYIEQYVDTLRKNSSRVLQKSVRKLIWEKAVDFILSQAKEA